MKRPNVKLNPETAANRRPEVVENLGRDATGEVFPLAFRPASVAKEIKTPESHGRHHVALRPHSTQIERGRQWGIEHHLDDVVEFPIRFHGRQRHYSTETVAVRKARRDHHSRPSFHHFGFDEAAQRVIAQQKGSRSNSIANRHAGKLHPRSN